MHILSLNIIYLFLYTTGRECALKSHKIRDLRLSFVGIILFDAYEGNGRKKYRFQKSYSQSYSLYKSTFYRDKTFTRIVGPRKDANYRVWGRLRFVGPPPSGECTKDGEGVKKG